MLYRVFYAAAFLFLSVRILPAQQVQSFATTLTHLGPYASLNKKPLAVKIDTWFVPHAQLPILSNDATKYAVQIDAATTPSSGTFVVVKSLVDKADILLNPRPDNDITKRTVKLTGDPDLQFIWPCDWSPDGNSLLIAGRGHQDPSISTWLIDIGAMQGIQTPRVLSEEGTGHAGFSPDGKLVAYVAEGITHDKKGQRQLPQGLLDYCVLISETGGESTKRIGTGVDFAWSPDSRHLLLATVNQLWITDIEGKDKKRVFPVRSSGGERYPHYVSEYRVNGEAKFRMVAFDKIGWLDDTHLVVTMASSKQGDRYLHDVWILDLKGKVIQVIPSASLYQIWTRQRALVLLEEHSERMGKAWYIKY